MNWLQAATDRWRRGPELRAIQAQLHTELERREAADGHVSTLRQALSEQATRNFKMAALLGTLRAVCGRCRSTTFRWRAVDVGPKLVPLCAPCLHAVEREAAAQQAQSARLVGSAPPEPPLAAAAGAEG